MIMVFLYIYFMENVYTQKLRVYQSGVAEITIYIGNKRVGNIKFLDIDKPAFYILYLNVNDKYMRRGIGTLLLNEVINQASIKGCKAVSLYVKVDNTDAIKFYESQKFFISLFTHKKKIGDHYLMTKQF